MARSPVSRVTVQGSSGAKQEARTVRSSSAVKGWARELITISLAVVSLGVVQSDGGSQGPATHRVVVNADGSFTPPVVQIRDGETVEWVLSDRTDSIVPASERTHGPGACPLPQPYDPADPNDFTGPLPLAPSGIFTLSPLANGFRVEQGGCATGNPQAVAGDNYLCAAGDPQATMDFTWESPSVTGVFIRLEWDKLQLLPGTADASFDFSVLDREIEKAVRNGKLYSLGIKAGREGTPDWIFSTNADGTDRDGGGGGVVRLRLQDSGSDDGDDDADGCGSRMHLGSPTDPMYQQHYFGMLAKVASHIKSRADWYRALAYIKPSGANLFSHENRLPKRCDVGCVCNTQEFAEHGYTPPNLYEFYQRQLEVLATNFPGKAMAYGLIQAGFPLINEDGGWEQPDGSPSNGLPLPGGTEQTETILDRGQADHGPRFSVQHNGLGPRPLPPAPACSNQGIHPAQPPFTGPGGCPNKWVLEAGADGAQITGFQTSNANKLTSPADLHATFENAYINSDASFVEIYEERFWEAENTNQGILVPGGKTIGAWGEDFHARRRDLFPHIADPFPSIHRHMFTRTAAQGPQILYYFNPARCDAAKVTYGTIVITP